MEPHHFGQKDRAGKGVWDCRRCLAEALGSGPEVLRPGSHLPTDPSEHICIRIRVHGCVSVGSRGEEEILGECHNPRREAGCPDSATRNPVAETAMTAMTRLTKVGAAGWARPAAGGLC